MGKLLYHKVGSRSLQKWPLIPSGTYCCARYLLVTLCYVFALFAKDEEVKNLGCKLFGYMCGQFALDTNLSTKGQLSEGLLEVQGIV